MRITANEYVSLNLYNEAGDLVVSKERYITLEDASPDGENYYYSLDEEFSNLDFAGYTCIEGDYLYKGYNGKLGINDLVVFDNVGSYSIVLKPPFILPNFPVIELKNVSRQTVKRKETFDDLFQTYEFNF